ncbi:MAG: glycoside hydrolase family 5 protein [Alphaproteobacteria bacterium]|nr:glycoside hydrolase family 5 protein [Alphaproteobacteria bacterium]
MLCGCAGLSANTAHPTTAPAASPEAFVGMDAFAQVAAMKRGVNVLSEDPGWTDPAKARFKPEDFKKIHDAGFSTVRIVMTPFEHMDGYYVVEAGWLHYLDTMVKAGLDAGLTVILDEHDYNFCGKEVQACIQKLNAFWAQVAPRYRNYSANLVFEILNEPHEAFTPELWNAQILQTLPIIRATNPTRNVIIGPGFWNSFAYLPKLELPVTDRHIIVTFHYYAPMEFTHQGSPWVPQYKLIHRDWGSPDDIAQLDKDFDAVKAWSDEWNRPILLGEFGAYETAPMDGRIKYTSAVARAAEARGFAWCYWQFDKDFIVYDIGKDAWVEPILHALIPPDDGTMKPAS